MSQPIRLAVVIGSNREGRFGPTVANWFLEQAAQHDDYAIDLIDLADHPLPTRISAEPAPDVAETLAVLTPRLAGADAFVIITPEYNHSFPASLKCVIDWHFVEWQGKPIALISYGGMAGGLRAVEHLRQVFAELHAMTIRDSVSFSDAGSKFDDEGRPTDATNCNSAAKAMLDQLAWWAVPLRTARAERPYGA